MPAAEDQAYFKKEDASGQSVHSHLTEMIHNMILKKDKISQVELLAQLENFSLEVKSNHFKAGKSSAKRITPKRTTLSATWLAQANLLSKVDGILETPGTLPETMPLFAWAGVGLDESETWRLHLAMIRLKEKHGFTSVRFFGKIIGTKQDYMIIEATGNLDVHKAPSYKGATPIEPPGTGLNMNCYFVAPSAVDDFVLLDDVTPEQVLKAATIRKHFSGVLATPVAAYPAFPGPESSYLRAQIARIAQATVILPQGKLMVDEESEAVPKPIVPSDDFAMPDDMAALDAWVHLYSGILRDGRTYHAPKPTDADDAEDEEGLEEEKAPLAQIGDDPPAAVFGDEDQIPAWTVEAKNDSYAPFAVVVAVSNSWPGAYAAINKGGDKYGCIYIGMGVEKLSSTFTPYPMPPILKESADGADEAPEVTVDAENALLLEIDERKNAAANGEGDADGEDE